MKKSILVLALCFVMLFAVAAVSAQEAAEGFTVTYLENDCLAEVPTDEAKYAAGDEVTVLFEPVAYKDYLIFYGWDIDDDGVADFGYNFNKFNMPEKDVELKAICIGAYAGGSTCTGCHLHGKPGAVKLNSFSYEPYYPGYSFLQ
ncbi:MAG: hypothetical protein IJI57_08595 [Flexilinea sp.]|nr:hypothetical protein [Flexilinea sp.]